PVAVEAAGGTGTEPARAAARTPTPAQRAGGLMVLDHHLDRNITIEAPQDLVFKYFTTSERWAAWWGPGSSIEPTPGGRVVIRYPNGVEGGGEVVEVVPPERIVFTFGFAS